MSDRLTLSNAIEDAGIPRDLATKADLQAMETRLTEWFTRVGIAGLIIATTALFGALHLWPPHLS